MCPTWNNYKKQVEKGTQAVEKVLVSKPCHEVSHDCKCVHVLLQQSWWGCARLNNEQGHHMPSIHNGAEMEHKCTLQLCGTQGLL